MPEPQIRYAIDPITRNTVDAQAGFLPKRPYECIKCSSRLIARQGSVLIWHFKHYGEPEAKKCPLYYGGQYEDLLRQLRTSEIEVAESDKEIRLIVVPAPYGRSLKLYGVLPAINVEELPAGTDAASLLNSMVIQHVGSKHSPTSEYFHPGNPEALIELNPGARRFEIEIESKPIYEPLSGSWTCDSIKVGDVFSGELDRAERVINIRAIGDGETIFVFSSNRPESLPVDASLYRSGAWYVVSFVLEESKAPLLEKLTGENWQKPFSFVADVVFPWYADPRSRAPVIGEAGDTAIVAIIPPENMDPEFEIVSIPLDKGFFASIPKAGEGIPRWFRSRFPQEGSRRLSIHWADRHRGVHLHVAHPGILKMNLTRLLADERPVGLHQRRNGESIFFSGLRDGVIEFEMGKNAKGLEALGLEPFFPPGYRFNVIANFASGRDVDPIIRRTDLLYTDLDIEVPGWQREGLEKIILDFDSLGSIQILFEQAKSWQIDLAEQDLLQRLRAFPNLPKKARWPLVRELLGAPPGTPHVEFPKGIKKRVRRAFIAARDERRK